MDPHPEAYKATWIVPLVRYESANDEWHYDGPQSDLFVDPHDIHVHA